MLGHMGTMTGRQRGAASTGATEDPKSLNVGTPPIRKKVGGSRIAQQQLDEEERYLLRHPWKTRLRQGTGG